MPSVLTWSQREEHSRLGVGVEKCGGMRHGVLTGMYLGCLCHLIHVEHEREWGETGWNDGKC